MRLFQCEAVKGPWQHDCTATYILQDPQGRYQFVYAATGQPHRVAWDSERIQQQLIPASIELPPEQWPVWADADLEMDIGL